MKVELDQIIITKQNYLKIFPFPQKKIKKCTKKKSKSKSSKNLTYLKEFENKNKNKRNEPFISGPIITLLKKTVDDYNEKKNKLKKKKEK